MGRPRKTWAPKTKASDRPIVHVAGYVRVSTTEQADSGFGLDAQRQAIEDYARAAGYELVAIYADEGLSGTLPPAERPGLRDLLNHAESGLIDAVIVKASDRIGRRVSVATAVYDALDAAGVQFLSITEPGLSSALLRAIFSGIAEEERNRIKERTSSGRKVKAERGGYAGGRVPYGYRLAGFRKDATWEIEPTEAEVVQRIFRERSAGDTYQHIAQGLNRDGIPGPGSSEWSPTAVYRVATNPAYTGTRRWREDREITAQGEYPAIISPESFRSTSATAAA